MPVLAVPAHLKTLSVSGGPAVDIYGFRGLVVGKRTWSETDTYSRTTLYASTKAGVTQGPRVESIVTERNEFFLRDGDGERAFRISNLQLPMREGHDVAILWAVPDGRQVGPYVYAKNLSTGQARMLAIEDAFVLAAIYHVALFAALLNLAIFGASFASLWVLFAITQGVHTPLEGLASAGLAAALVILSIWRLARHAGRKADFRDKLQKTLREADTWLSSQPPSASLPRETATEMVS